MNFYILDNDSKIIHLLSNIIENDFNNTVVGTTSNPQQAYDDAMRLGIDIMFIDYAMPAMDGARTSQSPNPKRYIWLCARRNSICAPYCNAT